MISDLVEDLVFWCIGEGDSVFCPLTDSEGSIEFVDTSTSCISTRYFYPKCQVPTIYNGGT